MNNYHPDLPRVACGFAAVIMTAITLGMLVVLPSTVEPASQMLAAATRIVCASI
jgi:hypothetical protein